jgi:hypothetical protein
MGSNRLDDCGRCELLPTTTDRWGRATQVRCPVHGSRPDALPADPTPPPVPAELLHDIARQVAAEIPLPPDEVRNVEEDALWLMGNPSFLLIARAGLAAGRTAAAAEIAYKIRAELVCCDVYDRVAPIRDEIQAQQPGWGEAIGELDDAIDGHAICYWGEVAARITEGTETDG